MQKRHQLVLEAVKWFKRAGRKLLLVPPLRGPLHFEAYLFKKLIYAALSAEGLESKIKDFFMYLIEIE